MKLLVKLTRIKEEECEIEVPDLASAKSAIESLLPDDFRETDGEHHTMEVINEGGQDVYGEIQPFCPRL